MKVKLLKTGETATFSDEYAARLVEQGKGIIIAEKKPEAKAETPEPEHAELKPEPKPEKAASRKKK